MTKNERKTIVNLIDHYDCMAQYWENEIKITDNETEKEKYTKRVENYKRDRMTLYLLLYRLDNKDYF